MVILCQRQDDFLQRMRTEWGAGGHAVLYWHSYRDNYVNPEHKSSTLAPDTLPSLPKMDSTYGVPGKSTNLWNISVTNCLENLHQVYIYHTTHNNVALD